MSSTPTTLTAATVSGTDVLVRDGAPHDTVLLLHGIGGRASSFADMMRRWPAGRRLIAWDMPGYGQSRPFQHPWPSPTEYADRLADICEELGLDTVDVVGQSLGAIVAANFAHMHVGIMRRLVLISPAPGYGVPERGKLPDALAKRIADFDIEGADQFAAKRAARLVHRANERPEIVDQIRATMATLSKGGHRQAVRLLASGTTKQDLARFSYRTLVLCGAEDVVTPVAGSRSLFDTLQARGGISKKDDRLHIVPDAGHAVLHEAPDEVLRVVGEFLEARE